MLDSQKALSPSDDGFPLPLWSLAERTAPYESLLTCARDSIDSSRDEAETAEAAGIGVRCWTCSIRALIRLEHQAM